MNNFKLSIKTKRNGILLDLFIAFENPLVLYDGFGQGRENGGSERVAVVHFVLGDTLQADFLGELGRIGHNDQGNVVGLAGGGDDSLVC